MSVAASLTSCRVMFESAGHIDENASRSTDGNIFQQRAGNRPARGFLGPSLAVGRCRAHDRHAHLRP